MATSNKTVFNTQPTSSTDNTLTRYVQGGITDVYKNRLGWWDGYTITSSTDDITIVLESKYNQRPDILAFDMYGKASLMWLVLQYNSIVDINEEFVTGTQIVLPTRTRVFSSILTYQPGGNPITAPAT